MQPQPEGTPAPNGTAPQGTPSVPVVTPPADTPPAAPQFSLESFSEDDRKYLSGQGITAQEHLTPENLAKVFNHARTSQQTAQQRQAELERIKQSVNPTPPAPTNPFAPVQPSTTPTEPAQPVTPTAPAAATTDEVTMFLLAGQLANNYPELKTELADGSFYAGMAKSGFQAATSDGRPNMAAITQYATFRKQQVEYETKMAELGKPGEGALPDAQVATPAQPAADAPMTKQMAMAIVTQDPNHPRYAEAKTHIETGKA